MKEAMERYGVSSGSLNSALTYGYSAGGYHFYRADEPKPDDSFFKSGNGGKVPPKSARLSVWKPGFSLNRPLPL